MIKDQKEDKIIIILKVNCVGKNDDISCSRKLNTNESILSGTMVNTQDIF